MSWRFPAPLVYNSNMPKNAMFYWLNKDFLSIYNYAFFVAHVWNNLVPVFTAINTHPPAPASLFDVDEMKNVIEKLQNINSSGLQI